MFVRRLGIPGERTPDGILTRLKKTIIGGLITQIEESSEPDIVAAGLLLLQLGEETVRNLSVGIERILEYSRRDGGLHDISIGFDRDKSGCTFHASYYGILECQRRLFSHCRMRKYDTRSRLVRRDGVCAVLGRCLIERA